MGKCPLLRLIRRGCTAWCTHLLAQISFCNDCNGPNGSKLVRTGQNDSTPVTPVTNRELPNCDPIMEVSICHKWIWCLIASGLTNADRFLAVIILYLIFLFCRTIRICCWIARLQWTSIGQMSSSVRLHPDHFLFSASPFCHSVMHPVVCRVQLPLSLHYCWWYRQWSYHIPMASGMIISPWMAQIIKPRNGFFMLHILVRGLIIWASNPFYVKMLIFFYAAHLSSPDDDILHPPHSSNMAGWKILRIYFDDSPWFSQRNQTIARAFVDFPASHVWWNGLRMVTWYSKWLMLVKQCHKPAIWFWYVG